MVVSGDVTTFSPRASPRSSVYEDIACSNVALVVWFMFCTVRDSRNRGLGLRNLGLAALSF